MTQVSGARKIFDWIAGVALIVLGVAGLVLPVLPGILFIIAGLAILSSHSPVVRRIQNGFKSRLRRARDRVMK